MKRRQKASFLGSISSKITLTKEKETARRKKGGEQKKAMIALLVFITATLEKNCWTQKGPFGGNVFKNPARRFNLQNEQRLPPKAT